MPVRKINIFDDLSPRLRTGINRFVDSLAEKCQDPSFPLRYGSALTGLKGRWKEFFAQRHPEQRHPERVVLEIGMHKGRSLQAMAVECPDWGFVGMDITYKRVVLSAEKAMAAGRTNICAVLGDARQAGELFAAEELSGIAVFFPDPWSKKIRQSHNKLLTQKVCRHLASLLALGGFFWMKTDCARYFAEVSEYFGGIEGFMLSPEAPLQLEGHHTTFEQKFLAQGQMIYQATWVKTGAKKNFEC
jgi:tRNA (guanine-N(7)-)-methyltransferase